MHISYTSTNGASSVNTFKEALLQGLAPDKGLFVPSKFPQFLLEEIISMKEKPYHEIAFDVTNKFLSNEVPEDELSRITRDAYGFDVPLEEVSRESYIMRLDQGPTLSFKDFAAQFMSRLMEYYIAENGKEYLILTATSGDTGSAVANAFHNKKNICMIVLFPEEEITDMQRKQMTTLGDNITPVAVSGKFDDCQKLVKQAFSDPELEYLNLSSANSINLGRLIPQSVYYFYAFSRVSERDEIFFSVPCGNFGNLTAGLYAQEMGLPVKKFIAAVNENDEFPRFLYSGEYEPIVPSIACISNAMNVGHPSNLVRIIHLFGGHMDEMGKIHAMPDMKRMRQILYSTSISDERTRNMIESMYLSKVLLEPHGSVAWTGWKQFSYSRRPDELCVSLETAHPSKFPEEIRNLLRIEPKLPEHVAEILSKHETYSRIPADYDAFKKFLRADF